MLREATEHKVRFMKKLIVVMTSRVPSTALRKNSEQERVLRGALAYLDRWEACTGHTKAGYLSASTAESLRVTLRDTLELSTYLSEEVQYKYLLTLRLSQDPIEKLLGIIRQLFGGTDHPSTQLLTAVYTLSFYYLVKAPETGNCAGGTLMSLVGTDELANHADNLLDTRNLDEASSVLQSSTLLSDHVYPVQVSGARLVNYLC